MSDADQLKAELAERDVPCPGCGYNLRGISTTRCPECGVSMLPSPVPLQPHQTDDEPGAKEFAVMVYYVVVFILGIVFWLWWFGII